jgi:hypothetical protein
MCFKINFDDNPAARFVVTMDNALNSIKLGPGRDGKNAVLMEWFDAIKAHDVIVINMEEAIEIAENKNRAFLETQRVYEVRSSVVVHIFQPHIF